MKTYIFISFVFALLLAGCQSTPENQIKANKDLQFNDMLNRFKTDPSAISYLSLWSSYMDSSQIEDTATKQQDYEDLMAKLEDGVLSCEQVDWHAQTNKNFWSLKPHITAQTCFESLGDTQNADFHQNAINFILNGILSNSDGEHYYSAYKVATWGDASDVIELSPYEVVDHYLQLRFYGQGLFYVYVVNNTETGIQKEVYFDNNFFLHQIIGIQYPFAGIENSLETQIIDAFAKDSANAMIAKAEQLARKKQFDEAAKLYKTAALNGSAVANYRLGEICLAQELALFDKTQCFEYLFTSAEQGYHRATLALALAYKEGLVVEQSQQLFEQLFNSISNKYLPGEAWYIVGNMYKGALGFVDEQAHLAAIEKSANAGYSAAQLQLVLTQMKMSAQDNTHGVQAIEVQLRSIAESGNGAAQHALALYLLSNHERGSQAWNEAEQWLLSASKQSVPAANYTLGKAYELGYFRAPDKLKAYLAHVEAAVDFYPPSQLYVGYRNDIGEVVEKNKEIALSWYMLCARANNLTCIRNVGMFFLNGIAVEENDEAAFAFFNSAAQQGHPPSITSVGYMYLRGYGVEKDINKANNMFLESCKKDDSEACHYSASIYLKGEGVTQDINKANDLFALSCKLNNASGCNNLGVSYQSARGFELNSSKAAELYEQGCTLNNATACDNIGFMYEKGRGVEQNIEKAKALYLKGCRRGYKPSCASYDAINKD